jgi:NADH:ubiquinone oxidoreductase subunit 4 (subunit M)
MCQHFLTALGGKVLICGLKIAYGIKVFILPFHSSTPSFGTKKEG